MNKLKLLKIALTASLLTTPAANAGQVPVVRPANLGISSPTLPSGTISTPTAVTAAPLTSAPQVSIPGASPVIGEIQPSEFDEDANSSGDTANRPAIPAVSATINAIADSIGRPELELTISQQAGLARTIESVLVNVEMAPSQRARLISIRENLEHRK